MARRFQRSTQSGEIQEPIVNLTPLIDVVFVILIMFILIAPLLELDQIELAEGGTTGKQTGVTETSPITVYVRKDNVILFNQKPVSATQLTQKLIEAKKHYPKARLQLFHDKQAHFGTYQQVKNAAESAGFADMDVILKPS